MSILETSVFLQGDTLIEKQFYSKKRQDVISDSNRKQLISAISIMAASAFNDEIHKFRVGDHEIILTSKQIEKWDDKNKNKKVTYPLSMFAIAEKNINKEAVQKSMQKFLDQFTNRFSLYDIWNKSRDKFQEFNERFDKIFKNLISKTDNEVKIEQNKTKAAFKKMKQAKKLKKSQDYAQRSYANYRPF